MNFQSYNVDIDPLKKVELSLVEPGLYLDMKKELLDMWENILKDRIKTKNDILNKVDKRPYLLTKITKNF